MCKGLQQGNPSSSLLKERVLPNGNRASGLVNCELCNSRASLYCQADDAYLCMKCDKRVHEANFLARRHIRCFLCHTCQNLTQRYLIGASHEVLLSTMFFFYLLCNFWIWGSYLVSLRYIRIIVEDMEETDS
ncbi:B-box domain protein 30-like [Durio zibethinus]|uniref:B-box domain protein 30-like n=1 Tax=Durio zibethinus TaxID=66656 RepID=A0A6P5X9F8_DURZI|nr:B-box domain protein 30-like [Durio zibethinus]